MEWISVDERLPAQAEWVLVFNDGAMNCMGYTPERGFEDWTYNLSGYHNINIDGITHWMPLPDPPETP